jgi:hypothetical protein
VVGRFGGTVVGRFGGAVGGCFGGDEVLLPLKTENKDFPTLRFELSGPAGRPRVLFPWLGKSRLFPGWPGGYLPYPWANMGLSG